MSQQEGGHTEKQHQNVRVVPIFVEGRDEPVVNKDFPDTGNPQHHMPEAPRMNTNMDFGAEMPQFPQGSIFERAKNIPVRTAMKDHIRDFFRDSESPGRTIPVNHMHPEPQVHKRHASPQPQQMPQQERARTFSSGASAQVPPKQQPQQEKPKAAPTQPQREQTPPQAKPAPVDAITKIQQIQKDVLDLMVKVEHFEGKNKKDKEYLYLDEMLTQNLLKLDTVDTEGKEAVKLARKEAVKCINRCLNVLEAKADAAEQASKEKSGSEESKPDSAAKSEQNTSVEPSKTSSRSSMYDNHDAEQISSGAVAESPPAPPQQQPLPATQQAA